MNTTQRYCGILSIAIATSGCLAQANFDEQPPSASRAAGPVVIAETYHDTSAPLSELVAAPAPFRAGQMPEHGTRFVSPQAPSPSPSIDPLAQAAIQAAAAPSLITNVEGLGAGMPSGVYGFPSDTNSAVGLTQVVEMVNFSFAVFDKNGTLLLGPKPTNTIWSGFGGTCETSNDGDAKVRYDAIADRWVVVQFSYFTAPYGLCYAVSATSDATGAWHRYFFQFNSQTDSPMLAVWPDAYYTTLNGVFTADNLDVPVCALDRAKMIAGTAATQQCFSTGARGQEPIPADLDGTTLPPAGAPNVVVNLNSGTQQMGVWKVHVDWTTPANSTITALTPLTPAAYTVANFLVPQPGTSNGVTPNMDDYRLAYRNFGDHESLVLSDEVASGTTAALRWYELRLSGGNPAIYQQGTYAPGDGIHRFDSSMAMDQLGNIAIGYSVGNATTVYPGIRYTGRLAGDPLGQMTQGEGTIINGGGAQTGTSRWGDYSTMSVDPVDGCTFWYSSMYIGENTSTGWRTRLASFRFPGCGTSPPPNPIVNGDFETGTLSGWTAAGTASVGGAAHSGSYAAQVGSTAPTSGDSSIAQTFTVPSSGGTLAFWYNVHCSDSVTYDWATATLKDNTANTTATVLAKTCTNTNTWKQVSSSVVAGHSYTLTLISHDDNYAGDATYTQYDDVTFTAATPPPPLSNGNFETGSLSPWTSVGSTSVSTTAHTGSYAALAGKVGTATNGDSSIAQTFSAPSTGTTLSFWYRVSCPDTLTYDWATATLKDNTAGTTTTPLAKTCTNTGAWVQVSTPLTANHSYTLTLTSHDDNYAGDPTYTLFDDVAVQ